MRWKRSPREKGLARAVEDLVHRDHELYEGKEYVGFLQYREHRWEAWVIRSGSEPNARLKARWPDEKLDEAKAALARFVQRERASRG